MTARARERLDNVILAAGCILAAAVLLFCLFSAPGCDSASWPAKSIIKASESKQDQHLTQTPYATPDVDVLLTSEPRGPGGVIRVGEPASQPAITIDLPDGKKISAPAGSTIEVGRRWNSAQQHDWTMSDQVGGMRTTQDLKGSEIRKASTSMPVLGLATPEAATQPAPSGTTGAHEPDKITTAPPYENPLERALARVGVSRAGLTCYVLGGLLVVGGLATWWLLRGLPWGWKIGLGMVGVGLALLATGYLIHHWVLALILAGVLLLAALAVLLYSTWKHQSVATTAGNIVAAVEKLPVAARDQVTALVGGVAKKTGTESKTRKTVAALKKTETVTTALAEENKVPAPPAAPVTPVTPVTPAAPGV